jgi:hypothetical protein
MAIAHYIDDNVLMAYTSRNLGRIRPEPFRLVNVRSFKNVSGRNGYKAMIIVDRVTMEDDLQPYGYDAEKVVMVSQSKAFMTTSLFVIWADQFFSDNKGPRRPKRFQGSVTTDFGSARFPSPGGVPR